MDVGRLISILRILVIVAVSIAIIWGGLAMAGPLPYPYGPISP